MFDKRCDYALNHLDKTAIVCQSVTGEHIRLTREDFSSDEEFTYWKKWSDNDYHKIQLDGRDDDDCLSFDALRDTPAPSAEDVFFAPILAADKAERRQWTLTQVKAKLTKKQYRRLCLYYLKGKDETEIAALENVNQSSISRSISSGMKIVKRFLENISRGTA